MAMSAMQRRWTADSVRELSRDDDAWPRYELIDGELVVTPAPRDAHPSSPRTDRIAKPDLYLDNAVAEYWIVDFDARVVER